MSIYLGTTDIAGISTHTISNAHSLFDFKWSDHELDDMSWVRADTFSWQSGNTYTLAYNHLVSDIQGITPVTETVGSYTLTTYRTTDGHKICLSDQENTVLNIYNSYGVAWYYLLDSANIQFKFPRTKYGFEGLRTNVGDKIDESLPNITGYFGGLDVYGYGSAAIRRLGGAFASAETQAQQSNVTKGTTAHTETIVADFNASRSSSTYQDNAPVQERATQMYLYFYVGDYSQTAIEQTAGLNTELFNNKADRDLSNLSTTGQDKFDEKVNYTDIWYDSSTSTLNIGIAQ